MPYSFPSTKLIKGRAMDSLLKEMKLKLNSLENEQIRKELLKLTQAKKDALIIQLLIENYVLSKKPSPIKRYS